MGLKEGTLQSLVNGGCPAPIDELGTVVFHHMLQAIDFLAAKGIVHRDIKPENILYISRPGQYEFQLGDSGVSNRQGVAKTFAGTILYMAPEMFRQGKQQTHKADVWSLFVTMLWTLDVEAFRDISNQFQTFHEAHAAIISIASRAKPIFRIREMARPEPTKRASAAHMLVECFGGRGLTTPRSQIPSLTEPAEVDSDPPTHSASAQKRQKGLRKNSPAAAGPYCIKKAQAPHARPRPLVGPGTEKRPGQLDIRALMDAQVPGAFPTDTVDTWATARPPRKFT